MRHAARHFVSVLSLCTTVLGLIILTPGSASAVTCGNFGYGVDAQSEANKYGATTSNNSVINPASTGGLVRSVYVIDTVDNIAEVGWFEDGSASGCSATKCDDVQSPHVLVYALVNGFIKCKTDTPALNAGQDYSFRVSNPDHDFDFHYEYDDDNTPTISQGFYATDHKNGYVQMASERHEQSDSLRADLSGVNSLGSGGNWNPLTSPSLFSSGAGGWAVCSWGATYLHVRAVGSC